MSGEGVHGDAESGSLFEVGGHKDVVVVDVEFAGVDNSLPQLAGVGLAEGHDVPCPLRVLDLKHQRGRVHFI